MEYENTMQESVINLFESVNKELDTHCKLNFLAMTSLHEMGYNGFKRWHRCRSRFFHEMKIKLANEMFDKFRIKAEFKTYDLNYNPSDLEEHLDSWNNVLLESIKNLGECNKKYFELTGMKCCIIEDVMDILACDYEKVGRYVKRFGDGNWLPHDMHVVDDCLHSKYKLMEEAYGY